MAVAAEALKGWEGEGIYALLSLIQRG